jgi:protein tyrosine phosphatase (PTP) superfamily phosphohydrolase (DUF442 family)
MYTRSHPALQQPTRGIAAYRDSAAKWASWAKWVVVATLPGLGALAACGRTEPLVLAGDTLASTTAPNDGGVVDGEAIACRPGTWVLVDTLVNARDLGGSAVPNGGHVTCGAIYRSAAPVELSPQDCSKVAPLGIRTIIDLRMEAERSANPDSTCVAKQAAMVLAPMPIPYNVSPADYVADLDAKDSVAAVFAVLADESAYPVDIHCVYGRDRTGVISAIILLALGASADVVMTDYKLTEEAGLSVYPNSLAAVLNAIAQQGGIVAYLASAGITSDTIARIRARLTTP